MASISEVFHYQKVEVADHVIAFISPEPHTGIVTGNSVAIAGDDSVLVVDSGHFPSLTKQMIAEIDRVLEKPVRFLVNTHWHPDHWMGNHVYREAYPSIVILSHPFTRRYIETRQQNYAKDALERAPAILKGLAEMLEKGTRRDGTPLGIEGEAYLKEQIATFELFVPELHQMKAEPPTVTLEHNIEVNLGKRKVRIAHYGRGNTAGDLTVSIPELHTLVTGDLVVHPTPYSFGSYLSEWVETLNRLKSTGASTLVPGHGNIQTGWGYVDTLVGLLQSVVNQTSQAVQVGLTLEQTRLRVNLEEYRSLLADEDPYRKRAFQSFFVEPAIERAYLETKFGEERAA